MRCEQAALNVTEHLYCNQVQSDRIFCVSCDIAESEVEQWLLDNPGCAQGADGGCCIEQLTGLPVRFTNSNVTAMWDLFEEDPLPPAQHPTKGNNNRRFFCYRAQSRRLHATPTGARSSGFSSPTSTQTSGRAAVRCDGSSRRRCRRRLPRSNLTHVLRMNLVGVTSEGTSKLDALSGAEMALRSHFCLCPSGDSAPRPPRTPALGIPRRADPACAQLRTASRAALRALPNASWRG